MNSRKTDIRPNDIIFSRIGAGLGKSFIVEKAFSDFSILHSLCQMRANEQVLPKFLLCWLRSELIQRRIWVNVQSIGVPDLGLGEIGELPIFLAPIAEQQEISSILGYVDLQLRKYKEYRLALQRLQKGLLQKLLTGKIRVTL